MASSFAREGMTGRPAQRHRFEPEGRRSEGMPEPGDVEPALNLAGHLPFACPHRVVRFRSQCMTGPGAKVDACGRGDRPLRDGP